MANILNGKEVAQKIYSNLQEDLSSHEKLPKIVLYCDKPDAATKSYMKSIISQGKKLGIEVEMQQATDSVEDDIRFLNESSDVAGVMIMHPFQDADELAALNSLNAEKDIEGRTVTNLGALVNGEWLFAPPTAEAVMEVLEHYDIPVGSKDVVIVGRSTTVGKPLAMMLLKKGIDATVTVCHSRTSELAKKTSDADILVCAVGRANFVTGTMVKPGAIVVDVGINFEQGKIVGDALFEEVEKVAGSVTPVPGGIGTITTAILFRHYGTSLKLIQKGSL